MEGIDLGAFEGNPALAPMLGLLRSLMVEAERGHVRAERQADVWSELIQAVRELTVAVRALTEGGMQEAVKAALLGMAVGGPSDEDGMRHRLNHLYEGRKP